MIDWGELTLFIYILARMSGFVLFNPLLGRQNIPGVFRGGFILLLSVFTFSTAALKAPVPATIMEMAFRILLELALGYVLGLAVNFFF